MRRLLKAFINSWNGLCVAFRDEVAFRQDVLLVVCGLIALPFLDVTFGEAVLLIFSLFFILIAELINTAIENIVDRIGHEYHELSKQAKDIGSAIVLMTITAVVMLWIGIGLI